MDRSSPPVFRILIRHFFDRFFDTEALSPQGDPHANINQVLGILAVPSAFFVLLFRPLSLWGWSLVAVRFIFLTISMLLMGFIMVFEWDALFPDRRDYQILTPLPLRLSILFLAKSVALGILLALFLVDVNFFGVLFWGGIDSGPRLLNLFATHLVIMVAGGLFASLAIAALQGILITLLPGRLYRRISATLQTALMTAFVMLLFLTPLMGAAIEPLARSNSPLLRYYPPYWFIGLYETLRPATRNPVLLGLAPLALRGLASAAAVFLLTFLPFYRRHARKILETPDVSAPARGRLAWIAAATGRTFLHDRTESAVFHFIGQTLRRSIKHRLFLATYGGFGLALAVFALRSGAAGLLRLSLTLSFVLVSGLRAAFNFPSELRANWAFQITETTGVRGYLTATRKWIALCAILPLFALLAPVEFVFFPFAVASFHLTYGTALSFLLMEILFFDFRKVPFTCSHFPGKINLVGLMVLYILGFTMYSSTMADLETWLAARPSLAAAFLTTVALGCAALNWRRYRSPEPSASLHYDDPGDPVVRTLGITQ